jgi:hypothetical protein
MKWLLLSFLLLASVSFAQLPQAPGLEPTRSDFFHDRAQMSVAAGAFALRAIDLGQTMYHLNRTVWVDGKAYHGRETWLPTQNKGVIGVALLGSGALTTFAQYKLYRGGHKRMAIATQLVSAAISGAAIYSSMHSTYAVGPTSAPHP